MAHQFRPVDRDSEMLLPHNMLDWVPEGHAVRVVIDAVERLMTRDLTGRLVPPSPKGSAAGPQRYDPVMLLTVWMYAYLRGVLSTRAVEDRCRYDATFRVACGRLIPDHTTFSRFRKHLLTQDGLAEDLFYRVLYVCACAGLGRLSVVAGDGVKIAANASKEANRTEAGLRKLAAQVIAGAREAAAAEEAERTVLPGTDLLLGGDAVPPRPDPRSRAGRVLACLEDLEGEREAAEAEAREQGQAYLQALAAGPRTDGPPPRSPWPRSNCGWKSSSRRRRPRSRPGKPAVPLGPPGSRLGRRPAGPQDTARVRQARARLEELGTGRRGGGGRRRRGREEAAAAAQPHRPGLPADAGPRRRVHPGIQLPGRRR